jgi:signal transduction histidine kinase
VPTALRTAIDLLAEEIASLRHLITELRPATLDELGLSAPLHALARRTEELTGLRVDVHVSLRYADGQIATRLLPDVELAVYRVVQEALTNASRHSGATQVRISVVEDDEEVWVEVADNGAGMSGTSRTPGFGITGMQERALLAGGHLDVLAGRAGDCDEGARGTVIRLVVPAAHRTDPDTGVLQGSSVSAPAQGPQS